jgi:Tol biopolymer transport system component
MLLTDGKSRNLDPSWSKDGTLLAYTSTRATDATPTST